MKNLDFSFSELTVIGVALMNERNSYKKSLNKIIKAYGDSDNITGVDYLKEKIDDLQAVIDKIENYIN